MNPLSGNFTSSFFVKVIRRYRFPPDVIRHAIWLYFRFTLRLRDVEELMARRGMIVSRPGLRTLRAQADAAWAAATVAA
jgi:transposase-like protein